MKQKLIDLLIMCDRHNSNIINSPQFSPSSSIDEIAEFISQFLEKKENI